MIKSAPDPFQRVANEDHFNSRRSTQPFIMPVVVTSVDVVCPKYVDAASARVTITYELIELIAGM
jgi:hypothetical protein